MLFRKPKVERDTGDTGNDTIEVHAEGTDGHKSATLVLPTQNGRSFEAGMAIAKWLSELVPGQKLVIRGPRRHSR